MTSQNPIQQMIDAKAVLAPLAGITDTPFRRLTRSYGCRFAFTEMIDVNGVIYNNRKTFELMKRDPRDLPLGIQLVGQDADKFSRVAQYCVEQGYRIIDINAGCPARKVVTPGKGSALLKDPAKLGRIVERLVKELDIPITVKIRSGWDPSSRNYMEVGRVVESAGASSLCIHTRTKDQMYKGEADHEITKELKKELKIPVFASGNILTAQDAVRVLNQTGCDGVYVARGVLGKPWIFRDFYALLEGKDVEPQPTLEELKQIMIDHYVLGLEYFDEKRVVPRMYKHIAWYLKGYKNLDAIMKEYREAVGLEAFKAFVSRLSEGERKRLFLN